MCSTRRRCCLAKPIRCRLRAAIRRPGWARHEDLEEFVLRVKVMSRSVCRLAVFVVCAAGLAPVSAAQAQWYGNAASRQPPLYPYELQPGQPYAVEVAPGTYVIHRPAQQRRYAAPHRRAKRVTHRVAPKPKRMHANRALNEEVHRRDARRVAQKAAKKAGKYAGRKADQVIHTRKIVREKPIVIETRRVVNGQPKVITRRRYVDDASRRTGSILRKGAGNDYPRLIHADAEITILGPDRMSIRLTRKGGQRLDVDARGARAN